MSEQTDDEVLVEGSYFPRADLPSFLGNFMRAEVEHADTVKKLTTHLHDAHAESEAALAKLADVHEHLAVRIESLVVSLDRNDPYTEAVRDAAALVRSLAKETR